MYLFILRRLLWTIPVLLLATFLTYALISALPGNPIVAANPTIRANPAQLHQLEHQYGFDRPWYERYGLYLQHLVQGDFGPSFKSTSQSVSDTIRADLPVSVELGIIAFLLSAAIGIPVGVISALRHSTWIDYVLTATSTAFFAIPSFVTAVIWAYYLTDYSGWFDWQHRIGPIVCLALSIMPYFTRLIRASMIETLQSEFIQTARSKGLPWRITVVRHALRNSLIPVVTNAGPLFGFVITGAFIIEHIFAVPGIADKFVTSVEQPRDANMVLGTTVVFSLVIIGVNLLVDLVIGWLDPRIVND